MNNVLVFALFAVFFSTDIAFDLKEGVALSHIWYEAVLFVVAMLSLAWQVTVIVKKNAHIKNLNSELDDTKKAYQEWRDKSHNNAQEIRKLIEGQFGEWLLSPGEKDVALLLIKGLSMKEIAEIRSTQEKTVRQQATNIYRKSGLSGRQELAAFFLEDILSTPIQAE